MKFFNNKELTALTTFLVIMIGSILLLSSLPINCFAQSENDVQLKFIKETDNIKSSDLYFNILKIWNNTSKPISGSLKFNGPDKWTIISFPAEQIVLNPGDTVSVPIRISPLANALGGISYIISATFRSSQRIVSTSAYVTLPSMVKWDFSVNKDNIYFTKNNPNTTFEIRLSNKGNTNELIKLDFEAGKLLKFKDNTDNIFFQYINLPAFKDSIIYHTVAVQENLNYSEKVRFENNWKESSVRILASTEQFQKSSAIQIHTLNSIFINQRAEASSPLNFDYQVYNLMSNQPIHQNIKVYGTLLFSKKRELQYYVGLQNINFTQNINDINLERQLLYTMKYSDKHNEIQVGYNVNGGSLHTINGRGISGILRINQKNSINYAVIQNPYTNIIGESFGYNMSIKGLAFNFGITNENKMNGKYQASSGLFGVGFTLLKHHSFSFQLLGSKASFNKDQANDTSVYGFSYKFNYNVQYKKFSLRLSSLNSEHNYIQNSGLQQSYLDSRYVFSDKVSISLYGNSQRYSISRYPYNFYNPVNYNSNDNLRLSTAISSGNVVYQIGPNYVGSVRETYNSISGYKSEYITYQPGLWCAAGIKLGGYRTLTPNITVSNVRFNYTTNDPDGLNYSLNDNIYYSVGLNYFDNVWRVNAYYTSGSTTDLYRSVLVDSKPSTTSSIQFRPSYENFFFNRKVKLSAYMNYAYYMPSGRENTSFNIRYDHYFKKGWNLSVSGFMYSNTRVDDELGRINTKDLNMFVGISKSFNIQQPRLKYYDYKSIFFNDLDGNKIKTDNEPPVTDIMVDIQKDRTVSHGASNIPEIKLITDEKGTVAVENLPKDNYLMTFTPLTNLQSLYFLNGSEQQYFNDKSRTLYIPLAESYRIKGKIILVRDPNSTEGKISLDGIRITATGPKGETFSVLTDNFGAFVLSIPNADRYKVHVNNVFGEQFSIESDEALVQFTQNKAVSLDFTFIEKARGIQFDGGELFKFNSLASNSETSANTEETVSDDTPVVGDSKSYAIQLIATKKYKDPTYFKSIYNIKSDVLVQQKNGLYKYYTGDYNTIEEAQKAISKSNLQGIAVEVDRSQLKSSLEVEKTQNKSTTSTLAKVVRPENSLAAVKKTTTDKSITRETVQTESVNTKESSKLTNHFEGNTLQTNSSNVSSNDRVTPIEESTPKKAKTNQQEISANKPEGKQTSKIITGKTISSETEKNQPVDGGKSNLLINNGAVAESSQQITKPMVAGNAKEISQTTSSEVPIKDETTRLKETVYVKAQSENPNISTNNAVEQSNSKKDGITTTSNQNQVSGTSVPEQSSVSAKDPTKDGNNITSNEIVTQKGVTNRYETTKPVTTSSVLPVLSEPISIRTSSTEQPVQLNTKTNTIKPVRKLKNKVNEPFINEEVNTNDGNYIYTIQLDASWDFADPKSYKDKYNLPFDVVCVKRNGVLKYYTGRYLSRADATADIARYGLAGYIVNIEESREVNGSNVKK